MRASYNGHKETVKALSDLGAKVNAVNKVLLCFKGLFWDFFMFSIFLFLSSLELFSGIQRVESLHLSN